MSGSALRETVAQGDVTYLKELLKGGANPCSADENGLCPIHFATWNGHIECLEILVVNDLGVPVAPEGAAKAKAADAKKWLRGYLDRRRPNGSWDVCFDDGTREEKIEVRRIRMPEGVAAPPKLRPGTVVEARFSQNRDLKGLKIGPPSAYDGANAGSTAFDAARARNAAAGDAAAAGADADADAAEAEAEKKPMESCVNMRTKAGWTALHVAAMGAFNDLRAAGVLLLAGCDPTLTDENGLTAFDVAVQQRNVRVGALLRKPRPQFPERRRAMRAFAKRYTIVDHPFREPPPFYTTLEGETAVDYDLYDDDDSDSGSASGSESGDSTRPPTAKRLMVAEPEPEPEPTEPKIVGGRDDAERFVKEEKARVVPGPFFLLPSGVPPSGPRRARGTARAGTTPRTGSGWRRRRASS